MKNICRYLSILLIIILFIIFYVYDNSYIEYFEDNNIFLEKNLTKSDTQPLELRLSNVEKQYQNIMMDISGINDRVVKYDNMYSWYETKIDALGASAKKASGEGQQSLKSAMSSPDGQSDPSISKNITGSLTRGADNAGDTDNKKAVNKDLNKYSPPF